MYSKCRYLRQRHKKGQLYYFCSRRCKIVELCVCRGCLDKEYKEVKKLAAKAPLIISVKPIKLLKLLQFLKRLN